MRDATFHADHGPCQLRAHEGDRLRAPHAAVVDAGVYRLPDLTDQRLQFIAPVETTGGG